MGTNTSKVSIVAGGILADSLLPAITQGNTIIGVDRGAAWLLEHGVIPDIAVGDFDSVTVYELQAIQKKVPRIEQHPAEKNETDLELALSIAQTYQPNEIIIYGSTGFRLDHTIASLFLLESLPQVKIIIRDENNSIQLVTHEARIQKNHTFFSVLPITSRAEVSITGAKYPLRHFTMHRQKSLGVSNEVVSKQARVRVHSGKVLVIESTD